MENEMEEKVIIETGMEQKTDAQKTALKDATKLFSKLGLFFFIGLFLTDVLQYCAAKLVVALCPEWLQNPNIDMSIGIAIQYLIGLPVLILLVKKIPPVKLPSKSMKAGHFFIGLMMCMAVAYASNIVGNMITAIIGLLKGSMVENVNLTLGADTSLILNFVFMVICAPLYEEYIFRKLVVDRTVQYGQGVAILMSGLMFGLAHGNLNQFAFAFTIGMFFAFIYVKTGRVRYGIMMHMLFNFVSGVLLMAVTRKMNFFEYMNAVMADDLAGALQVVQNAFPAWVCFMVLTGVVLIAGVAGLVLLIVFRKRFTLERGEVVIPKGKRFNTIFVNVGMGLYCLYLIGLIIKQLFS